MSDDDLPFWRRCEKAWASYLRANGFSVSILADANHEGAPLVYIGDRSFRQPDIQAKKAGQLAYWEVKQRNAASVNLVTGDPEYWISYDSFADYYDLARIECTPLRIILHDGEVWSSTRKWLQVDIATVHENGERTRRRGADGEEVDAWVWPAAVMSLVDGPEVSRVDGDEDVLQVDDGVVPVEPKIIGLAARDLRRRRGQDRPSTNMQNVPTGVYDLLREDSRVALDVARRSLGIPELPRYSVMRVGLAGVDLDDLLGLMEYGIRVFIISDRKPEWGTDHDWIRACEDSRLLEWATVEGSDLHAEWVVDGRISDDLKDFISRAPSDQRYNHGQYVVVHRDHLDDILVSAGAGTGKTETMSERIVFLLATSSRHADPRDPDHVLRLRLDEIVLVTFTRESAREMRERIARTLMLRQRLCEQCVLPTVAWMLELSNTEIETIHTYSKKLVQREGSRIGFGPGFEVGEQLLDFYSAVDDALSPNLNELYRDFPDKSLPAAHEFREFVTTLWRKMSGNGFSPLGPELGRSRADLQWGRSPDDVDGAISAVVRTSIEAAAKTFAELCVRNQVLPVSELVATAARAVSVAATGLVRAPRYLFVDEFQDTDSEQISMILDVRRFSAAKLFVVGDEKQGIYRFRGAEGNAFAELSARALDDGVEVVRATLTQNFRSGSTLLDSLHPYFSAWGKAKYLRYDGESRLKASGARSSKPVSVSTLKKSAVDAYVVAKIRGWLEELRSGEESIAVLCRTNKEARKFAGILKLNGIFCETRVEGDFFRTPAVSDLRVFLEAVLDVSDDAALLELSRTRWFPRLSSMPAPMELSAERRRSWGEAFPPIATWADRLANYGRTGNFERADLDALRARVVGLYELLQRKSVLGWLMDCDSWMQPRTVLLEGESSDDVERNRYGRCFDHLLTILDENFGNAPISPHGLLEWLRLKIATDESEDEPDPTSSTTKVTVVTVHKAKGLQYHRVIVPPTSLKFTDGSWGSDIAIVPTESMPQLLWRWSPTDRGKFTNVHPVDRRLWDRESLERIREESRLLYVAMTRAREELDIVVLSVEKKKHDSGKMVVDEPASWADLLGLVKR
jgi:superfamily I DNA/RNA helicase